LRENIIIEPDKVWKYFCEHKEELGIRMHKIAEREEYGISIYITEDLGCPVFEVRSDDVTIYTEHDVDEEDCAQIVKNIYETYLSDSVISVISGLESDDQIEREKKSSSEKQIDEREQELSDVINKMLDIILDDNINYLDSQDEITEDVKDHICEYLYLKWGFEIYRPMIVEYEDGAEEFLKYPYSQLELEDEDNHYINNL
jgi:hypothetical protein